MSPIDADSAADCPIYDGLATPEELRQIIRLIEGSTSGSSAPARLTIGHKLGRGSEGDVFKATFDGAKVALKVMKRRDRRSAKDWRKVVSEYLAEAKLLRICQEHRAILGVHAVVEFPSSLLTDLEGATRPSLLPGFGLLLDLSSRGTLRDLVEKQMNEPGQLMYTDNEALGWSMDIASAVQYLHSLKPIIIHRDIKLENVLLFDGPDRPIAKLCDFGLAAIGYETLSRATMRRLDSQNSRNVSRSNSRQVSRNVSRQSSRQVSRQASQTSASRVEDTANTPNTVAGARLAAAAERALAAAEMEAAQLQASTPTRTSFPQVDSGPIGRLNTALKKKEGQETPSLPRRVSIAGDFMDTTPAGENYKGDGFNPRLLTAQLLQVQESVTARPKSEGGQAGGGLRTLGGISTRRRLSVRQTVAFALPESSKKAGDSTGGQGGPEGAADLPNLVKDDDGREEESFNARRRLSRVSSAGSFTSRASSVSVTGRTGSLAYLAPEVDCRKTYNESADVFSFAVLMFQMFARKSLVLECRDTEGALEKLQMRMTEGYRPPRPKGCHADVWEVIDACWQPISTDRPLMDEVMQQLEAVVMDFRSSTSHRGGSQSLKKVASGSSRRPTSARNTPTSSNEMGRTNVVHPLPSEKQLAQAAADAPPQPGCACTIC